MRRRWPCTLALPFLLVLAAVGPLAAQDLSSCSSLLPVEDPSGPSAEGGRPKGSCPTYRLLPDQSCDCGDLRPEMAVADLTVGVPLRVAQAEAEAPKTEEVRKPNHLLGALIPLASWGLDRKSVV